MKMMEAIAERIKYYLDLRGITQYELGKITAIPHNTMQGIIHAKYIGTNSKNLFLIIKAFNVTVSEFFDDISFDLNELIIE